MVAIIDNNLSTNSVDVVPPDVTVAEENLGTLVINIPYVMSHRQRRALRSR